eukprot:228630_1
MSHVPYAYCDGRCITVMLVQSHVKKKKSATHQSVIHPLKMQSQAKKRNAWITIADTRHWPYIHCIVFWSRSIDSKQQDVVEATCPRICWIRRMNLIVLVCSANHSISRDSTIRNLHYSFGKAFDLKDNDTY